MKKFILIVVLPFVMFACGSRQNQPQTTENEVAVLTVDQLMATAAENVDHEVVISGLVTHVCKNGGQRCFVMGATDDVSIRVEAGDAIDAFKQEHVGDELQIVGILRLVPVGGDHVCSEDAEHAAEHAADAVAETAAEPAAEEYVPTYFIDGLRYVVLTEGEPAKEPASGA